MNESLLTSSYHNSLPNYGRAKSPAISILDGQENKMINAKIFKIGNMRNTPAS